MFDWEDGIVLTTEDFVSKKRLVYIENFIYSNAITLIYSAPKQGKTWLSYGIAKVISKHKDVKEVFYFDMDNPIEELKERGINESFTQLPKIKYIVKSKLKTTPLGQLKRIAQGAGARAYENYIFFLDTTKDFVNMYATAQAEEFMNYAKDIRDAGGTVIILHHATKSGSTISGDAVFINSPDTVYELKQLKKENNTLSYSLNATHARGKAMDITCKINTKTLELELDRGEFGGMSEEEILFVQSIIGALKENEDGINRSNLLESIGRRRDDKGSFKLLERFTNKFWIIKTVRNQKVFRVIE